jgi:hypothetical protein
MKKKALVVIGLAVLSATSAVAGWCQYCHNHTYTFVSGCSGLSCVGSCWVPSSGTIYAGKCEGAGIWSFCNKITNSSTQNWTDGDCTTLSGSSGCRCDTGTNTPHSMTVYYNDCT